MNAHVKFLLLNLDVYYNYTQSQDKVWHIEINLYNFWLPVADRRHFSCIRDRLCLELS